MISSLVATMFVEDLRSFKQVLAAIRLKMSCCTTISKMGAIDNAIYFTQVQFVARRCLPVPPLVKQFLHFTRAPLTLVHSNVFRILMGCNVLNFLYQLDISMVEICFIYTLKLGIGGRLSMSAHSPWLQFLTKLPESLNTEAKWVVLVKGLWYETSGSPRIPFDLNQSLSFPGLFQVGGTCTPLSRLCFLHAPNLWNFACFDMLFFSEIFIGKRRQG